MIELNIMYYTTYIYIYIYIKENICWRQDTEQTIAFTLTYRGQTSVAW